MKKMMKVNKNSSRFEGNAAVLLVMGILVFGILASGVLKPHEQPTDAINDSCIDFDPPSTTDQVTTGGVTYDLIKKGAGIENSKVEELTHVGTFNGENIYKLEKDNYFGEQGYQEILYRMKGEKAGYTYFDLYLKDGLPIPAYILGSKKQGGKISIVTGDTRVYPPIGFNTQEVTAQSTPTTVITLPAPAYVYSGTTSSFSSVQKLAGIVSIGKIDTQRGKKEAYFHKGTVYLVDGNTAYEYLATDKPLDDLSGSRHVEQLRKVELVTTNAICWYTPVCKPAVYLYPTKPTNVNIQVDPNGFFTNTLPDYPDGGWNALAYPNGDLMVDNQKYSYLYYEDKIHNAAIDKPSEGFVVEYKDLPNLYNNLLPKLGLSEKEIQDFKGYWQRVLPASAYYFVGVMSDDAIAKIEPMKISPKPDTTIRVRLYFKALDKKIDVKQPLIIPVNRPDSGFVASEWGGMVESKDGKFTCSQ